MLLQLDRQFIMTEVTDLYYQIMIYRRSGAPKNNNPTSNLIVLLYGL
jgi:hypothetical protein